MIKIKKLKNKKIVIADNLIYLNTYNNFNGNLFYVFEYAEYLNIPAVIIASKSLQNKIKKIYLNKYQESKLSIIDNLLYFFDSEIKIFSKKLLILDYSSAKNCFNFEAQKIIYNYADAIESIKKPLSHVYYLREFYQKFKNKLILIGDKNLTHNIDYHFPLCLNFNLFKKFKNFEYLIFNEIKTSINYEKSEPIQRKTFFKSHENFYILNFLKKNFFDRANRLILECKFYNKNINIYNQDNFIDSITFRFKSAWQEYDLNQFKNKELNLSFKEFFNQI